MYHLTVTLAENGGTIKTDNRAVCRELSKLAQDQPDVLEVDVVRLAKPRAVKFKGVGEAVKVTKKGSK